jgi:hypothetical protein
MSRRLAFFAASLVLVASPAWPEGDSGVLYRCPGNDYNNTLTPSEAEKLHCKKVEDAAVSVVRSPGRAASASTPVPAAAPAPAAAEVRESPESAAMRTRASNSRRQLETRLRSEESKLARLEQEFNGGDPERRKDETSLQTYLDRVARMRTDITRRQIDIAEMRRELDKLPSDR